MNVLLFMVFPKRGFPLRLTSSSSSCYGPSLSLFSSSHSVSVLSLSFALSLLCLSLSPYHLRSHAITSSLSLPCYRLPLSTSLFSFSILSDCSLANLPSFSPPLSALPHTPTNPATIHYQKPPLHRSLLPPLQAPLHSSSSLSSAWPPACHSLIVF